ncbi:glycoside hydrolase, family 16 [Psychromonas ingrahamii 37]|uniref:Glycoside hydrolase, family 16 n=1 Tax=Psychromonas ingrahamii (strain DSM 17664 / CCUG 51855 / 37) TaxID=357804 RepID=A1SSE7_PSYIN|nr:glycoside hydrolase family 16 protein [Psychromonas ingrahamii]ABM02412.1 glycoside hydrolase, family 16 [Psychromonas ingrahamii 37]
MTLQLQKMYFCIGQKLQKSRTTLLAALLMLSFSSSAMAGWELQWIDKFDGTSVNWDNWTAQTQANYNNEVQCYTNDDSSVNKNYDVSDGTLKIIARKQNINCPGLGGTQKSWTSGRLNSKDKNEFLYGRIESRIKFHNLEGGTWPAFWMLENRIAEQPVKGDGDSINWPNAGAGEIDVWEWFSNAPNTYITNFFNTESCAGETLYSYPNGGPDVQNWHNYALEWSKDNTSFYIDDILVVSQDMSSCNQYQEPMFVLLNVAMGGNLGGNINPSLTQATMEIDYVAHCQPSAANNATYCNQALAEQNNGLPEVSIKITQNGYTITDINPDNGLVTLSAQTGNINADSSYSYDWYTSGLASPIITGNQINFDPSSMVNGYYYVSVILTDDQNPTQTDRDAQTLKVISESISTSNTINANSTGGSISAGILLFLGLLGLFRARHSLPHQSAGK